MEFQVKFNKIATFSMKYAPSTLNSNIYFNAIFVNAEKVVISLPLTGFLTRAHARASPPEDR
jgi:hypothetical protein